MSTEVIETCYIDIHDNVYGLPFNILDQDEHFGLLTIKVKKTQKTNKPTFLLFSLDNTGSMNDCANYSKYTKKIDYAKQTMTNIIKYLSTIDDVEFYICVHAFNMETVTLIDTTIVNKDNMDDLIVKINSLTPSGATDIENALVTAEKKMKQYHQNNPSHEIGHIFMTDGCATFGENNPTELSKLINTEFPNIFIGFGDDHNTEMLRVLSENKNSDYHFIDNMENTSLIYGESIHQFIYPAAKNIEMIIENGLIYDWQKNVWSTTISEPVFCSETEKLYQIKTKNVNDVSVKIYGNVISDDYGIQLLDTAYVIPSLYDVESILLMTNNLTKYAFRQKVQELLYESRNVHDEYNVVVTYKNKLRTVFRKLRAFIRENQLSNDNFLKMLCDDLYITYKTVGCSHYSMFATARQHSQGRQKSYNISSVEKNICRIDTMNMETPMKTPRPRRVQKVNFVSNEEEDDIYIRPFRAPRMARSQTLISCESENSLMSLELPGNISSESLTSSGADEFTNKSDVSDSYEFINDYDIEYYTPDNTTNTCYSNESVLETMNNVSNS